MLNQKISGLIAAPFTPFDENGELNLELIPSYYEMLKRNRVSGAFICGSTGEGVSLTFDEKVAVMTAWAKLTKKDPAFTLMMLLGGTNIKECQQLAKLAEQAGVDVVSFTSPSYFKPANVDQLAKCCIEIARAAPNTAFYYYHIPVLTGGNFQMIDLLKKVDGVIPNFRGIKYTHEDFMDFLSCMNYANRKYDMLWGRDENMLSALVLGNTGAVGSTYNYAAPLYLDLIEAYNEGDFEKANSLQQQSIDMIRLLGKYGGISVGKAYMKLIGLNCGEFRLPVKNMSAEQFEVFKTDVDKVGFQEFCVH
ncbi:MAG: dihydrodipicolinate synthetase [Sphingobacterium sp.]|jgi:N-acetylneuraminate lyase|uniref:dihydrodipicolinate synthase family protein n=1 Tax=unclassified Sphingobacterium TaxID=2609468 RepID=UPI000984CCCD|nr:dihydrodipicolinate synthase family protein [Sphingobacterium sp. CZ-UAM]MDF2516951.1 dihydrodipicolinate synthetase [Sphingobacterium sp.]OOG15969.1 dihydrodipicolinate synthetase [Sphingobacterium sp. CZ-UAM]